MKNRMFGVSEAWRQCPRVRPRPTSPTAARRREMRHCETAPHSACALPFGSSLHRGRVVSRYRHRDPWIVRVEERRSGPVHAKQPLCENWLIGERPVVVVAFTTFVATLRATNAAASARRTLPAIAGCVNVSPLRTDERPPRGAHCNARSVGRQVFGKCAVSGRAARQAGARSRRLRRQPCPYCEIAWSRQLSRADSGPVTQRRSAAL